MKTKIRQFANGKFYYYYGAVVTNDGVQHWFEGPYDTVDQAYNHQADYKDLRWECCSK